MPRRRLAAVLLLIAAVVWVLINGPVEGPVLIQAGRHHGLTVADLLSVLAVAAAAWLWLSASQSDRGNRPPR